MAITYTYTFGQFINLDISLTKPNGTTLKDEITDAGLVGLLNIYIYPGTGMVEIVFSAAVSTIVLNAVVQAHTGLDDNGAEPDTSTPIQSTQFREVPFTPINGQTSFTLPSIPINKTTVDFFINNIEYPYPSCFTVNDNIVTWTNLFFTIEASDAVLIKYIEETN